MPFGNTDRGTHIMQSFRSLAQTYYSTYIFWHNTGKIYSQIVLKSVYTVGRARADDYDMAF